MTQFIPGPMQALRTRPAQGKTVEEIWYIIFGHGELWRSDRCRDYVSPLAPGTCLTITRQHFPSPHHRRRTVRDRRGNHALVAG
jgi:mannose-6-phosphate isomerase-like protein (cupin superfamily)